MTSPLPDDPSLMDPSMIANENTIMKTFKGDTYSVVVAYGPETGIPSDAQLSVSEITGGQQRDGYCEKLSDVVDSENIDQARIFDISLLVSGVEVEPKEGTAVSVKIILNEVLDGNISVVHLPEDKDADVVDTTSSSTDKGMEIRFDAEGFSAYAIVYEDGVLSADKVIENFSELQAHVESGKPIYIRSTLKENNAYHYLSDTVVTIKGGPRTGIIKTKNPYTDTGAAINDTYPAAAYYFEDFTAVNATSATCKIYCFAEDGTTKKYLKDAYMDSNQGKLSLGTAEEAQTFTVKYNSIEKFTIRSANNHYINEQGGANWGSLSNNDKVSFSEWYQATELSLCTHVPRVDDPYRISGKTFVLLKTKGGDAGRALQSTPISETNLASLQVTVVAKKNTGHSDKLYVSTEDNASLWTFTWANDDMYYVTDEAGNYLTISHTGLSMSTTPVAVRVVPGTGDKEGQISLMNGDDMLTFSGSADTGFNVNHNNDRWLYLAEERDLTPDYEKTYSAKKISVSDPALRKRRTGYRLYAPLGI